MQMRDHPRTGLTRRRFLEPAAIAPPVPSAPIPRDRTSALDIGNALLTQRNEILFGSKRLQYIDT
jgi:hypothetical protein